MELSSFNFYNMRKLHDGTKKIESENERSECQLTTRNYFELFEIALTKFKSRMCLIQGKESANL